MRVLLNGSVLVLVLGVAGLLMAQHGGGGGHSGGSGGHIGGGGGGFHASSSRGSSGFHNSGGGGGWYPTLITPQSYSGHLTFSTPGMGTTGLNRGGSRPVEGRPVWGRPPIRRPGRGYGYYGVGLYPYLGYGYGYYPDDFYGSDYYGGAAPQQQYPQYEVAPDAQQEPYYPPVPYQAQPQPQQQPDPLPSNTPMTIILKDGQKLEVQNYAIMNGMLWDFTRQNSKRIPLGTIDVAASSKATEAAGGSFPEESFGGGSR